MIGGSDLLGLAAALVAAACFDGAIVFQALEAREIPTSGAMRPSMILQLLRRPRWLAATGLAILGWPFQLIALSLASITLVQPTLSLGLVLLLVMGARTLHERIGAREALATAAIVIGVVGTTLAAPKHSDNYSFDWKLIAVLGVLGATAALPYVLGRESRRAGGLMVVSAGAAIAAAAFMDKLITSELAAHTWGAAVGWGVVTALAAGVGLLSEMSALQRRPVSRVAPPIFVISTVVPVLCAPFLTGETWVHTPLGGAVIVGSLAIVAAGGFALGQSHAVETLVAASHRDDPAPDDTAPRPP